MAATIRLADPGLLGRLRPAAGAEARLAALLQVAAEDRHRDGRTCWVVEEGGTLAAAARLERVREGLYSLLDVEIAQEERRWELGLALLQHLAAAFRPFRLEAATWQRHSDPFLHALYTAPTAQGSFRIYAEKLYVRRPLGAWRNPYAVPFTWRTLPEAGEAAFLAALGIAMAGSPARDLETTDPEREFFEMREMEGDTHDPTAWRIALLDGEPAGVMLGNRFPDGEEATFTFLGLRRDLRGRGLGAVLHACGLDLLRELGAERYLCSTDVRNTSMMRIYARHGCQPFDVRRQYVWTRIRE